MALDDLRHKHNAPFSRNIGKSHQPGVRYVMQKDQLSEVGIDRHQHSAQRLGQLQQSTVTGVRAERASLQDVVASAAKRLCKATAGAAVNQKIHGPATETVASVSPAITACA